MNLLLVGDGRELSADAIILYGLENKPKRTYEKRIVVALISYY